MSGTVSLRITLRYSDLDEFASRYADNVSSAGLFLRTRTPKPTGTRIKFELLLSDGARALAGEGVVASVRSDEKAGMAIRFHQLEPESQAMVDRIVKASGEGALAPAPLGGAFGHGGSFQSAWAAPGTWGAQSAAPSDAGAARRRGLVRPWESPTPQAALSTEVVRARSPITGELAAPAEDVISETESSSARPAEASPASAEPPPASPPAPEPAVVPETPPVAELEALPIARPRLSRSEPPRPAGTPSRPPARAASRPPPAASAEPASVPTTLPAELLPADELTARFRLNASTTKLSAEEVGPPVAPEASARSFSELSWAASIPGDETTEEMVLNLPPKAPQVRSIVMDDEATAADAPARLGLIAAEEDRGEAEGASASPAAAPEPRAEAAPSATDDAALASEERGGATAAARASDAPTAELGALAPRASSVPPAAPAEAALTESLGAAPVDREAPTLDEAPAGPPPPRRSILPPAIDPAQAPEVLGAPYGSALLAESRDLPPRHEATLREQDVAPSSQQLGARPSQDPIVAVKLATVSELETIEARAASLPPASPPSEVPEPANATGSLAVENWAAALGPPSEPPPALPGSTGRLAAAAPEGGLSTTARIDLSRHLSFEVRAIDAREAVIAPQGAGGAVIDREFEADLLAHDENARDAAAVPAPADPASEAASAPPPVDLAPPVAEDTLRLRGVAASPALEGAATARIEIDPSVAAGTSMPELAAVAPLMPLVPSLGDLGGEQETVRVEAKGPVAPTPMVVSSRPSSASRGPEGTQPTAAGRAPEPAPPAGARAAPGEGPSAGAAVRALVLELVGADARLGSMERGRFHAHPHFGSSVPAWVAVDAGGACLAGAEAARLGSGSVRVRELLVALAGGATELALALNDGRPTVRLGERSVEVLALLTAFFDLVARAVARERVRVFVVTPVPLLGEPAAIVARAAKAAGLELAELVPHGVAAARAYGLDGMPVESALVVDLGPSHLGVSVLRRGREGLRSAAARSLAAPSVAELDRALAPLVIEELKKAHPSVSADAALDRAVAEQLERLRVESRRDMIIELRVRAATGELAVKVGRPRVYQAAEHVVARVAQLVRETLGEAGVHPRAVGAVIVAGRGASFVPIAQAITSLTGVEPRGGVDPEDVALLGVVGGAEAGAGVERSVKIEVLEHDIGIGLPGGRFHPLITAGTHLPAKVSRKHATTKDSQAEMEIALYEGRGDSVAKCSSLGSAQLSGLPKARRGELFVELEIEVDGEAVVSVTLFEPKSGARSKSTFATQQTPEGRRKELAPHVERPSQPPKPKLGFLGRLLGKG